MPYKRPDINPARRLARFAEHLKTGTDFQLRATETELDLRMGNIHKFCPWPALEESLAQDIAAVWREQKLRSLNKGKEK